MKKSLLLIAALFVSSCVMPPPELPRQELPRQEIQPKGSALTPGMIKKHIAEIRSAVKDAE